jgi:hypothetical protein
MTTWWAALASRSSAELPRIGSPNRSWCRCPRRLCPLGASQACAEASDFAFWQIDVPGCAFAEAPARQYAMA